MARFSSLPSVNSAYLSISCQCILTVRSRLRWPEGLSGCFEVGLPREKSHTPGRQWNHDSVVVQYFVLSPRFPDRRYGLTPACYAVGIM
jgi:hypothetical protein